jgi:hypothetical protein
MNNPISFSSVKLDVFTKDGIRLKPASGFILQAGNQLYLITNWHVVSGWNVYMEGLPELVLKPHLLKTAVHMYGGSEETGELFSYGIRKRIALPLYDEGDSPTWIEHERPARDRHRADVVALPIQVDLTLTVFRGKFREPNVAQGAWDLNIPHWSKISAIPSSAIDTDVDYGPPDAVHVIGYPRGWEPDGTDRTSSAFWRTSFIASEIYEPGMLRSDTFFIDPCAPDGMTGSPVVGMKKDCLKLLGVYSDHPTAEFGANAGLVCGASLLKQLLHSS